MTPKEMLEVRDAVAKITRNVWDSDGYLGEPIHKPRDWELIADNILLDARKVAAYVHGILCDDDDYLLTTDWLKKNAKHCVDEGYWDVPPSGDSWCEIGPISFVFEPYYDDGCEGDSLLATDWQIDGDGLPQMIIPKTRGDLRALCRMVKHELPEVPT